MVYVLDSNFLAITAIVTVAYQVTFFIIAWSFKFDKVTDFAGGTNFVVLAILTFFLGATWHARQIVLTLFVIVWGVRLGGFLLMRILQWGADTRFDETRENFWKFAAFWVFQAIWVFTVSLPLTIVNATLRNPSLGAADYVGWVMWGVGFLFEVFADQQKLNFKKDRANKGRWCDVGVWGYSRHPNYFGELMMWWGIFVSSTRVLHKGQWAAVLGPITITIILLFLSGIPLLEASADKNHGGKPEYALYKRRTSPLIPLPPALYKRLPGWAKLVFLFELPLYNSKLEPTKESLQAGGDAV
ncbi:hypothetical protein KFL_000030740 [Klebsormidium nitens]|uniref:Uncharacterized protein n=1 Tax=Klebsormidium nitens TaxID=105231 RepID=A0A1Y1HMM5_KLENI|nr:hypothetical protein KFL_000030740 [Klebsormidium nitens]|eukprot:GAQ77797.1 hypothetical protein KFL_000030740 [Klebsormidium nitens]